MLWGDARFTGTCGTNRRDGAVWATRVRFDAAADWPAEAWHILADEEYETLWHAWGGTHAQTPARMTANAVRILGSSGADSASMKSRFGHA